MPPHAIQDSHYRFVMDSDDHDLALFETASASASLASTDLSSSELDSALKSNPESKRSDSTLKDSAKASLLDRFLDNCNCDCNPCAAKIQIANPASALFKVRICSECGEAVYKYRQGGYQKEERFHEGSRIQTKIYVHPSCLQMREDRHRHRETGFADVLQDLEDQHRAHQAFENNDATVTSASASPSSPKQKQKQKHQQSRGLSWMRRVKRALKPLLSSSCLGTQDHSNHKNKNTNKQTKKGYMVVVSKSSQTMDLSKPQNRAKLGIGTY